MKKEKSKNAGITLIALIITIIVMLILAGISLNAVIGENGILTYAIEATFVQEMTTVKEALSMWKVNKDETEIPVSGLVSESDLESATRLIGEGGYYRTWSLTETKPDTDITLDADTFNSTYESEFVYYPLGVQDLYYLDLEEIGVSSNNVFIIDASNSMVYMLSGSSVNGTACYSLEMYHQLKGSDSTPTFAEAEISGSGDGTIYAGNTASQYNEDGSENEDYTEYGFEIIASNNSDNVYKLYNNGNLYAKGVKGTQLNTSESEMEAIDESNWAEFTVPSEIGSYKEIIQGNNTIYVIDDDGYLWAWGDNTSNKLGLTDEQQNEYTGRDAIKLDIDGKTVSKVFGMDKQTFVITTDNCLYGCGLNSAYQLGLGHSEDVTSFVEIDFDDVSKISNIMQFSESRYGMLLMTNDNKFYATGQYASTLAGNGVLRTYSKFVPVLNGYVYVLDENDGEYVIDKTYDYDSSLDVDSRILKIVRDASFGFTLLLDDNTIWHVGDKYKLESTFSSWKLTQHPSAYSIDVKDIYEVAWGFLVEKNDGSFWACKGSNDSLGVGYLTTYAVELNLPNDLSSSGILEIFSTNVCVYYLSNDGELFVSSVYGKYAGQDSAPTGIVKVVAPEIETLYPTLDVTRYTDWNTGFCYGVILFQGKDGKIYSIGNSEIMYRDSILQKNWKLIASNVSSVSLGGNNSIAYVDANNNLFVAGEDARMLGLGISTETKIANFTQVNDSNINGKVKEVKFGRETMYVLTTDGVLLGTGRYSADGVTTDESYLYYPGWDDYQDNYTLVEILSDVTYFSVDFSLADDAWGTQKMAISNGILYFWGRDDLNVYGGASFTPRICDLSSYFDIGSLTQIIANRYYVEYLLSDGSVFVKTSYSSINAYHGILRSDLTSLTDITSEYNGEVITDLVSYGLEATYMLSSSGRVFGWGVKSYLGIGSSSSNKIEKVTDLGLTDIVDIAVGNGFVIATKSDGTVWGTGSNLYGVLGRWVGVGRGTSNSRYKTAFNWVECPELEI